MELTEFSTYSPTSYDEILELPATISSVEIVRKKIATKLLYKGITKENVNKICVAIDEAITNAIEHGSNNKNQNIVVKIKLENAELEVCVKDFGGILFNPVYFEKIALTTSFGVGGRGILLIKNLMDEVYFIFYPYNFTEIIMKKNLSSLSK